MNSIDYNPYLDQIVLSVRGNSELWAIDHSTSTAEAAGQAGGRYAKGGDLLYRWGNPQMYGAGNGSTQMLFQQHDAQWIEPNRPGEGNMLIFNNGLSRPGGQYSSVDEIVPPVDANGNYMMTSGPAYGPQQLAWTYAGTHGTEYYAEAISGAHRLPNGNTLACYGTHGVLVEVTPEGETVWEYVNPVVREGPLRQGETPGVDHRGHNWNAVFKVQRYSPDYEGFTGRDLTPKGLLEIYSVSTVNAASYLPGPLAPGAIVTGFGEGLASGEGAATDTPLPTKLAGASVEITDSAGKTHLCGMFYASDRQLNFCIPDECAHGAATLTILRDGGDDIAMRTWVEAVAPGLFAMNAGGQGVGAIVALRIDTAGNRTELPVFGYNAAAQRFLPSPIDLGGEDHSVYLLLFGTGFRGFRNSVEVTIGGVPVPVIGVAAQGEYVGLDQMNVGPIPPSLAGRGEVEIVVTVDGKLANRVAVNIQ
ncbi:MAG: hypothetical protein GY953_55400 [bacterium]|nr:hypothetical protein [bacterium]